jgi:hypothetical protein
MQKSKRKNEQFLLKTLFSKFYLNIKTRIVLPFLPSFSPLWVGISLGLLNLVKLIYRLEFILEGATTFELMTLGMMPHRITTISIRTLSIRTLSIRTLSIRKLGTGTLNQMTLSTRTPRITKRN